MPRIAKPFPHQGFLYTTAGGTWVKLCPKADGLAEATRLLAAPAPPKPVGPTLADVLPKYLDHCRSYYILPSGMVSREPTDIAAAFRELLAMTAGVPVTTSRKPT